MSGDLAAVTPHLDAVARQRLERVVAEITRDPALIATRFPAAARLIARGPTDPEDPDGVLGPTLDDEARAGLLVALRRAMNDEPGRFVAAVVDLYEFGDTDEKRAVLRALPALDQEAEPALLGLVADALRSNDNRLIAAALGSYAAEHLDAATWRQGVLKCLFVGVPLAAVARLAGRADTELARMVADFTVERVAAGRDVPVDVWPLLEDHPRTVETLLAEARSPHPDRRAAAKRALAARDAARGP